MKGVCYLLGSALAFILFAGCTASSETGAEDGPQWTKVKKDIRMPLPLLRTLNEGIANDGQNWFFSQQHYLVKTTIDPLEIVLGPNLDATPKELKDQGYNHIGDIDHAEGYIFGGIEKKKGDGFGVLAKWSTKDLSLVSYAFTEQDGAPWVAVNSQTRKIYSNEWHNRENLTVYDMDTFKYEGVLTVPGGLPDEIQGGAFYKGDLYLAVNGNCSVWKLNMQTTEVTRVLSDLPNYKFYKHQYEMEGIDFWDLSEQGLGVLHLYGNFMALEEKSIRSFSPPAI